MFPDMFTWCRQDGDADSANVRQIGGQNEHAITRSGRIARSVITRSGETNYLTTYKNGGMSVPLIELAAGNRGGSAERA